MFILKISSEKGKMPQFAGAKLHLIYQITKLLAFFLLFLGHFPTFWGRKDFLSRCGAQFFKAKCHYIGRVAFSNHAFSSSSKKGDNLSYTIS